MERFKIWKKQTMSLQRVNCRLILFPHDRAILGKSLDLLYRDDQGHDALMQRAVLNGLTLYGRHDASMHHALGRHDV